MNEIRVDIYSPAPVTTPLHRANAQMADALCANGSPLRAGIVAMPLPDSINAINALAPEAKPLHLPIVTTVDFLPAIHQSGPDWHAYDRANADLKMAAALYDVAFGVLVISGQIRSPEHLRGKRIGVPARPSSVRLLTEALLRDGWGILDAVELVDIAPPAVADALASGRIDATTWNLLTFGPGTIAPAVPGLLEMAGAHWIEIGDQTIARINAANPFRVSASRVQASRVAEPGSKRAPDVTLLSFKQGLAVWSATPHEVVTKILERLSMRGIRYPSLGDMADWPSATAELFHPAACAFFRRNGIAIDPEISNSA
ncbi:MAG: ABC transporter substrate-binding protein [Pseudorhodoplanes sp.]|uniref:ABC transporter substrate-binding protein n=1 Tax=Pseudorhodoplanes sp. TaxID=1934341 RepID=UPI003D097517